MKKKYLSGENKKKKVGRHGEERHKRTEEEYGRAFFHYRLKEEKKTLKQTEKIVITPNIVQLLGGSRYGSISPTLMLEIRRRKKDIEGDISQQNRKRGVVEGFSNSLGWGLQLIQTSEAGRLMFTCVL